MEHEHWHGIKKLSEEQSAAMDIYLDACQKDWERFFADIEPYIPQEWKEEKNCE